MDIVAATDDNTEFYLPLSGKTDVSNADFVIFEQADKPDTTNYLVRKKLMFERRQRKRTTSSDMMDINMALDVRPNAMCQLVIDPTVGDIIKGRGEGALNMHVNPTQNVFELKCSVFDATLAVIELGIRSEELGMKVSALPTK